ncbi:MAG: hypothetical protein N2D54_04040, partial [Chloroflexota bacterium]
MNKKTIFVVLLTILLLSACAGTEQNSADSASEGAVSFTDERGGNPLNQLVTMSLLLEVTDYPITGEQAKELLPLWKLTKALVDSDTTAEAELDAVVAKIEGTMTAAQFAAFENDQLDRSQMDEILQELGVDLDGDFRGKAGD